MQTGKILQPARLIIPQRRDLASMRRLRSGAITDTSAERRKGTPMFLRIGCAVALLCSASAVGARAQTVQSGDLESWLAQPTATADWGGLRSALLERGINLQASYIGEVARNTNGLHGVATDYVHAIAFGADVDLGKLGIDPGGTFRTWLTERSGRDLGPEKLGSLFQTFEVFGQGRNFRLNEFSLAQAVAGNLVNLKGGFYPMGKDFGSLPGFCNWISNGFCGHPLAMPFDSGWDDDPSGHWGGRVRLSPNSSFSVQTGVFQVNPTYTRTENGFKIDLQGDTGVLYPLEVTYSPSADPRLAGVYKIGGYFDTSNAADQFDPKRLDRGRIGYYIEGQQKVFSEPLNAHRGLSITFFYAAGDTNTGILRQTYHFGLSYEGTLPGRDLDTVNIGWVAADLNPRLVQRERLAGKEPQSATEHLLEANYNIVLGPWLSVRPGVQYDVNPGGYASHPNAFVFVLQTKVTL
jgi:porin